MISNLPNNIKVRLIATFLNRIVTSAVMPFMALYLSTEINKMFAGIFLIAMLIINYLFTLVGGYLGDKFIRKRILLLSNVCSTISLVFMTTFISNSFKNIIGFVIVFFIYNIVSAVAKPILGSIIMDSTTPENRRAVYTIDYWLINLSLALGTAMGGFLYSDYKIQLFIFLTITTFIMTMIFAIWLKDDGVKRIQQIYKNVFIDALSNYRIAIKDRAWLLFTLGTTLIYSAEYSISNYVALRLNNEFDTFNIGEIEVDGVRMMSLLQVENTLIVVTLTFLIAYIIRNTSNKKIITLGLFMYSVGYIFITYLNDFYFLLIFGFIATLGELIYAPIKNSERVKLIPEEKRSIYLGFGNLSYTGGELIARLGIILSLFFKPSFMTIYIAILLLIGSVILYNSLYSKKYERNQEI
ncbi:MAG: MDR family MFS transporter [Bacillota bacterium]